MEVQWKRHIVSQSEREILYKQASSIKDRQVLEERNFTAQNSIFGCDKTFAADTALSTNTFDTALKLADLDSRLFCERSKVFFSVVSHSVR